MTSPVPGDPPEGLATSLEQVGREGLLAAPGASVEPHDGVGRVQLSFTVVDGQDRDVRVPPGVTVFDSASWNGIAIEDIVIDPLAMPIGADVTNGLATLETMRRIRDTYGLNMTCGASNVSFGMPGRHELNGTFLSMAMTAGLTSAIMDTRTPEVVAAVKATDLMLGHDEWGMAWISRHRAAQAANA